MAMTETALQRAGLDRANGLISCLTTDADNVFVTLTASGLNERLNIISRAERESSQPKLHRAGATSVICPPVLGALRVAQMLLRPAAAELLEMAVSSDDEVEIAKVDLTRLPKAWGQSLSELALPAKTGLLVVAVNHAAEGPKLNPTPDYRLREHDELIVTGTSSGIRMMMELYGE